MLGPLELLSPLGQGAMASVWRAHHPAQGVDVAVKIMTSALATQARHRAAFRAEIQSAAQLHHPNIVMVLDHGEVPKEPQRTGFFPGSPYLVMEMIEGGTLKEHGLRLSWPQTLHVLEGVLLALSHAHAHGIIHRDIKPANILLDLSTTQPEARLTDFGIAHAFDLETAPTQHIREEHITGTPRFMAPEQVECSLRTQGPWTDLYALGCVAYWLLSGRYPFDGSSAYVTMLEHIKSPVPRLQPRFEIPDGLDTWLYKLLEKHPHDRFTHAADALWALRTLANNAPSNLTISTAPVPHQAEGDPTVLLQDMPSQAPDTPTARRPQPHTTLPPMPASWRAEHPPQARLRLQGAGLRLHALRPIPLVGRVKERDAIWRVLARARDTSTPQLLVLRGPSGVGKSRLVEWMLQRANEVGAAQTLHTGHNATPGPLHGLRGALIRNTRTAHLSREEAMAWFETYVQDLRPGDPLVACDAALLASMATPQEHDNPRTSALRTQDQHGALGRWLSGLARQRPVLLWLDDIHWEADSMEFVRHVLTRVQGPIVMLVTTQEEALATHPENQKTLASLEAHERAHTLHMEHLAPSDHRDMVRSMLGLEASLVESLATRTEGNPLFAVQLVGSLVERGLLHPGPNGLELRGSMPPIPNDLHELWLERTRHALGSEDMLPLVLLATLGREASFREWYAVLREHRVRLPDGYLESLLLARLVVVDRDADEIRFVHAMLHQTIERLAITRGLWEPAHLSCARVMERLSRVEYRALERLGHHLMEAGHREQAVKPLLLAAWNMMEIDEFGHTNRQLHRCEEALKDTPSDHPHWHEHRLIRAWIWARTARPDDALATTQEIIAHARHHKRDRILGIALRLQARLKRMISMEESHSLMQESFRAFERAGDRNGQGKAMVSMGWASGRGGDIDRGLRQMDVALEFFDEGGDERWYAVALQSKGYLLGQAGRYEEAEAYAKLALHEATQRGELAKISAGLNLLGDLTRYQEQWEKAREFYERGLEVNLVLGAHNNLVQHLNIALVSLGQGRYEEAWDICTTHFTNPQLNQSLEVSSHVSATRLVCFAIQNAWADFDQELEALTQELEQTGLVDQDILWCAGHARDIAKARGYTSRAERAHALTRGEIPCERHICVVRTAYFRTSALSGGRPVSQRTS